MNTDKEADELARTAKRILDTLPENLDVQTLSTLRQARRRAIQSPEKKIPWLVPAAGLAMVCAFVAVLLLQGKPQSNEISWVMEDLDLLATTESLDFYGDLEFYSWLEEREGAG